MSIPERSAIKTSLIEIIKNNNGEIATEEAYRQLQKYFKLTKSDLERKRSGRSLFEHEVR